MGDTRLLEFDADLTEQHRGTLVFRGRENEYVVYYASLSVLNASELDFTPMPSSVLMPEYPAPYGLAALTNLGRLLEYHPQDSIAKFGMPQVNETEVEQQRMWHPGWNLPPVDPENDIACIDAYLY